MNGLHSTTRPTPAQQLRSHGLHGIELHHVTERREAELHRDHIAATLRVPVPMADVRQWLGSAMIRIGASIAGDAAKAPRRTSDMRPKTGGAA